MEDGIFLQECKTSAQMLNRWLRRKASKCVVSLPGTVCTAGSGYQIRRQRDKPYRGKLSCHLADAIVQALIVMDYNDGRMFSLSLRSCQEGAYIRPAGIIGDYLCV